MKAIATLLSLAAAFLLAGCSFVFSPTSTVKAYMAAAQKGDVDRMTQLFSDKAIREMGLDSLRSNNQRFAEAVKAFGASESYQMEDVEESPLPPPRKGKRVRFFYKGAASTEPIKLVFDLSWERMAWKIDQMGGAELELNVLKGPVEWLKEPPPPPRPFGASPETAPKTTNDRAPISAGVLNAKAVSLPKPAYPPIARATKASGTVVVQVTVDENGNVIAAQAISGHPLLQAAAVAAARSAKFSPTLLAGQPVKVNGTISYTIAPE